MHDVTCSMLTYFFSHSTYLQYKAVCLINDN
jgi:hypothetical protein